MAVVLKSSTSKSPGFAGVASFNLDDLAKRASDREKQSEEAALSIIRAAEAKAEAILAEAAQRGREEGLKEADTIIDQRVKVAVDAAVRSRVGTLQGSVQQLWKNESNWLDQWNANMLDIALKLAGRIARSEIKQDPTIILSWAREALKSVRGSREITIAVHPETLSVLGTELDALCRQEGCPEHTHIVPDETIEPAGVVIRQDGGEVDIQMSTQISELQRQLGIDRESNDREKSS